MRTRAVRAGAVLVLTAGLAAGCQGTSRRAPYADNPLLLSRQPLTQSAAVGDRLDQIAQAGPRTVVPPPMYANGAPPSNDVPPSPTTSVTQTTADTRPLYTPAVTTSTPPATELGGGPVPPLPAAPTLPAPAPLPAQLPPAEAAVVAAPAPVPSVPETPVPAAPVPPPVPAAPVPAVATPAPAATDPVAQASLRKVNGRYGAAADYTWLQGELDRHYRGHLDLRYRPASEEDTFGGKVRLEDDPRLAEFRAGDIVAVEGELIRGPDGAEAQPWAQYPRYHIRDIRLIERK
jgi:hypothetical protein